MDFNPRTHVGCDEVYEAVLGWLREFQSTHPRGVRRDDRDDDHREKDISIHAPTWGATWLRTSDTTMSSYFNPRTHVGCDTARPWCGPSPPYFNPRTHVGCDFNDSKMMENYIDFNPRTHVGCDLASSVALIISSRFQSTHPRGVRQRACPADLHSNKISIHAPTWGATTVQMLVDHRERFQSTHPRGVRPRCRVRHPG